MSLSVSNIISFGEKYFHFKYYLHWLFTDTSWQDQQTAKVLFILFYWNKKNKIKFNQKNQE